MADLYSELTLHGRSSRAPAPQPRNARSEREAIAQRSREPGLDGLDAALILDRMGEGVIVTNAQGEITYVNEAAERLHGVSELMVPPEAYSETYHLLTEGGDPYPPHDLPLARAVLNAETIVDARWLIERPDGTRVLAIGTARPVYDVCGRQSGGVLTIRDDTARHAAETELAMLNETLESRVAETIAERERAEAALRQAQKMEAVGQLTGGIAHDFNNLLTVISGSLELLRLRAARYQDDRIALHVDRAISATDKAASLTQRLLAFSRRQPLDPRPSDLNRLITDLADLIRRTIGETIVFDTDLEPGLPAIVIDANQMENALLNLAVNARDAMPGGGRLGFATRLEPASEVATDLPGNRHVRLVVEDTGAGMDADTLARVFEPFFTTKGVGKGTGLGLSMVHGFINQSGGHIDIASTPGAGTTVTIRLPIP